LGEKGLRDLVRVLLGRDNLGGKWGKRGGEDARTGEQLNRGAVEKRRQRGYRPSATGRGATWRRGEQGLALKLLAPAQPLRRPGNKYLGHGKYNYPFQEQPRHSLLPTFLTYA
jgi:hypothetical protein